MWNGNGFIGFDLNLDSRLVAVLASFLVSLLSTPLVITVLRRVRLIDHPNDRSSHTRATVRGAGWGVVLGVLGAWFVSDNWDKVWWWLPIAAMSYGLIGFVDDLKSLPAGIRLSLQILVSSVALTVAWAFDVIAIHPLLVPVGAVMIVAYVNAFNFMDGVNAISGLQAAVVGGILTLSAVDSGALDVQIGGLAIAGAALGFLPFNTVRVYCFLGDVGSYFIGAWISMLCLIAVERGTSVLVVVSVMAIYAADTAHTLLTRMRRGDKWWTPHRQHVYQRLTDQGFSHLASAATVGAFTAVNGVIGLLTAGRGLGLELVGMLVVLLMSVVYVALPGLVHPNGNRKQDVGRVGVG